MFWFTADEHYNHRKIIQYSNRPFKSINEMNETIIENNNKVVSTRDTVIHAGDFTLLKDKEQIYNSFINRLNGTHVFLKGSHDYWLKSSPNALQIWERKMNGCYIVVCHYAMRTWARSHYNSFQLYGHSHGKLKPMGKQHDIGVDNNKFYPVSFKNIVEIMKKRPNNKNFIRRA
jgi:calcineurin-like phosphoesterase family protein